MNFKTAYLAIIEAITGLGDLPDPDLDPVSAEGHGKSRALFIEISPSYTASSGDVTLNFVGGDPRMTHDIESAARVTIHVHVRPQLGDAHKSLLLLDKVELVQEAVRALSANPDTDFFCHVDDVALDIPKDSNWAAARLGVAVGAFQT